MPPGKLHFIVKSITAIPAKNHIAKAITTLQPIYKFFRMNYLTAQDTVNIGECEFYFLYVVLFKVGYNLIFIHKMLNNSGGKLSKINKLRETIKSLPAIRLFRHFCLNDKMREKLMTLLPGV